MVEGAGRLPVHRYGFPVQETSLRGGESLRMPGGDPIGALVSIDSQDRTVDIRKQRKTADVHPEAVFAHDIISTQVQKEALVRIGGHVADYGNAGDGAYGAAPDLLLRQPPRLDGEPVRRTGETALDAALRIARKGSFGVLPIQGPPGAGKTFTAARMVCELVRNGARVGITANSHKVIVNLLDAALAAAEERGLDLRAVRKISGKLQEEPDDHRVTLATENGTVFEELADACQIGAGTAWLWARPEALDTVDVLFVDEAAQMSLANVLAISHAGPGLVLLGDPQQLDQPAQGAHPDGAEVSALGHLLGSRQTIEERQGLFLEETWRLHPEICAFTSEAFYEGKLNARPELEGQRLISSGPVAGTGLRFLPVRHHGNQSSSDEEADRVAALVRGLVDGDSWVDRPDRLREAGHTRRRPGDRALQRPGLQDSGAAARGEGGHSGQVPGTGSARRRLLHGHLDAGGGPARDGVPLQPEPPQRGHVQGALRLRPGGLPRPVRPRMPHPPPDAARQRLLPLPRAGQGNPPLAARSTACQPPQNHRLIPFSLGCVASCHTKEAGFETRPPHRHAREACPHRHSRAGGSPRGRAADRAGQSP